METSTAIPVSVVDDRNRGIWGFGICKIVLGFCWFLLHQVVNAVHFVWGIAHTLECHVISSGLLSKYKNLQIRKVKYLAIVVDSQEAVHISRVIKLLDWLSALGVKHVCLYDMEGELKKNKEMLLKKSNIRPWEDSDEKVTLLNGDKMTLELLSISDGKEAAAEAASFLCSKYSEVAGGGEVQKMPIFTELDVDNALRAVGCNGPEPDLLLICAPARCHLGFPAWRMKYTELVHMGTLNSMKYGALIKVIYKFIKVKQNYEIFRMHGGRPESPVAISAYHAQLGSCIAFAEAIAITNTINAPNHELKMFQQRQLIDRGICVAKMLEFFLQYGKDVGIKNVPAEAIIYLFL